MLGRTLGSAALAIAVCFSVSAPLRAQNLEAGKSPAQIFNGACTVCHKSARGLVKSVPPNALPSFLRQHYTTSSDMAGALSGYLLANGAVDRRPGASEKPRRGREAPAVAAPVTAPAPAPAQNNWWPFQRQPTAQTAVPDNAGEATHHPSHKQRTRHKKKSKAAPVHDAAPQQPSHAAGSDGAKPESANSSAAKPEPASSAPAQRPAPASAAPPAAEPKTSEPKSAEPKTSEPRTSEPKASEPKASEPKAAEPKAAEPKAEEPKPSDSKAD